MATGDDHELTMTPQDRSTYGYIPAYSDVSWVGLSELEGVLQHPYPKSAPTQSMQDDRTCMIWTTIYLNHWIFIPTQNNSSLLQVCCKLTSFSLPSYPSTRFNSHSSLSQSRKVLKQFNQSSSLLQGASGGTFRNGSWRQLCMCHEVQCVHGPCHSSIL